MNDNDCGAIWGKNLGTVRKPELDAAWSNGNNAGIAKGRAEGMAEGRTEGATELATAIKRLNRGDTVEKLMSEGFSKEIVNSAREVINEL